MDGAQIGKFANKLPFLVVYVEKKERERIEKLLGALGATNVEWSQENLALLIVDVELAETKRENHEAALRKSVQQK